MAQNIEKILLDRWQPMLAENKEKSWGKINDYHRQVSTAIMLENELRYLTGSNEPVLNESTSWAGGSMDPNSGGYFTPGTGGNAELHKLLIPMVRRTFPELLAHEIVGVQPMTGPVGIAFALRFRAGQTYAGGANREIGYNTIDPYYSGTGAGGPYATSGAMYTSAGESLGSKAGSGVGNDIGLGIGAGAHIKELNMTIEKEKVEAGTRKLRSRWSLEVAQDLQAMHGINIEREMMDALSYEITAEIDRELLAAIRTSAASNPNSATVSWNSSASFDGRWEHEKYRNLYNLLVRKANTIAISTRRGPANWVVASPTLCAMFEASADFAFAPVDSTVNTKLFGVSKVGTLGGRFTLYRDTFFTGTDAFTLGYKGPSPYDTGVVYCPYIQLMQSKAIFENSFNPSIGLMSRYAILNHLFGSQLFYVNVTVSGLPL